MQARLDYGSSTDTRQWFWHHRSVQTYQGAVWRNPGDLLQMSCPSWSRRGVCQAGSAAVPDEMFRLHGTAAPATGPPPPPPPPPRDALSRAKGRGQNARPGGDDDPPRALPRGAGLAQALGAAEARQGPRSEPARGHSPWCSALASSSSSAAASRASIASGVSSSSDSSTTPASASASGPGGKTRFGIATTRIPADEAERMPFSESSIAAQRSGATSSRVGGLQVDVRGRLAVRHFLRGNGRPEELLRSRELEEEVDQRPVRRGGDSRAASARRFAGRPRPRRR